VILIGAAVAGAVAAAAATSTLRVVRAASGANPAEAPRADAIVVFGAAAWASGPSPELQARLVHAAALHRAGAAPRVLCAGGFTGKHSEALAMRAALEREGVPSEALLIDEGSTSTRRAITAARRAAATHGWRRVLLVSSPYHMHRAAAEARRQGLDAIPAPAPSTPVTRRFAPRARQTLREVVALWWYAATAARRPAS
jgi:uncharacterized SAM-binding protein YcdF (DUF218 family)